MKRRSLNASLPPYVAPDCLRFHAHHPPRPTTHKGQCPAAARPGQDISRRDRRLHRQTRHPQPPRDRIFTIFLPRLGPPAAPGPGCPRGLRLPPGARGDPRISGPDDPPHPSSLNTLNTRASRIAKRHRPSLIAHRSSLIPHHSSLIPHHSSLITDPQRARRGSRVVFEAAFDVR